MSHAHRSFPWALSTLSATGWLVALALFGACDRKPAQTQPTQTEQAQPSARPAADVLADELLKKPAPVPSPRSSAAQAPDPPEARQPAAIDQATAKVTRASFEQLMTDARQARDAKDYEKAAELLQQALRTHGSHRDASRAALELGLLQLDQLDQPHVAARSLRLSIALGLDGAPKENALVRLVEAYLESDDRSEAEAMAATYRQWFPRGRRLREIDRLLATK